MLASYSEEFTIAENSGAVLPNRKSKFQKYECKHCSLTFSTSVKAMCLHVDAHKNDETIKCGAIKTGNFKGELRPEHHWYDTKRCRFAAGTDTRSAKVIIPESNRVEKIRGDKGGYYIYCRSCVKFRVKCKEPWGDEQLHGRAKSMSCLEAHESICGEGLNKAGN